MGGMSIAFASSSTIAQNKPVATRRYAFISWQIDQLIRAHSYNNLEDQQAFVQSIIDGLNKPTGITYTRQMTTVRSYVKKATEYYFAHIADDFAQCLTDKWVTMYGADWCPHCQMQKSMFGSWFAKIKYIECETNPSACTAAWIQWYPTWVYKGEQYQGEQSFNQLAEISQCSMSK